MINNAINRAYTTGLTAFKVAGGAISGGCAVGSLFYVCNFPNEVMEQMKELAQDNISTGSLAKLAAAAFGLYSIRNTVKSLFSGGSTTASVIAGIFTGLIVGSWDLEKASSAAWIAGAITGVICTIRNLMQPPTISRGDFIRKQIRRTLAT